MAIVEMVRKMKACEPDHYTGLVRMHLSFLLDLATADTDCDVSAIWDTKQESKDSVDSRIKKAFATPMSISKKKIKGVMDGVPLTQEGVCQVYQIIEYLGRPHNITQEGLFRKHGNLKKQQALKERLNKGVPLNLDEEEFSVHECAAVLKHFLAILPEPLLTDACYRAHCQVPALRREGADLEEVEKVVERQISCVQLLFQLIPEVNLNLLHDLLKFLSNVARHESDNRMNADNLGTLFSTNILCPRKLSPETLQSNHQLLSKAVTFMIEHAEKLFELPEKLCKDVQNYVNQKDKMSTPKNKKGRKIGTPEQGSPVVSTIFTFVDREASLKAQQGNQTDQALAQLYAHVQSMPESAHKRRLVAKLNDANGRGTPEVATSGSVRTIGRVAARQRRRSGEGFINLLTPRRKRPITGSYSVKGARNGKLEPSHSFRRQTSSAGASRPKSPHTVSSPAVLSPCRDRLPSPPPTGETPVSQASEVCAVDEVDTPGKESHDEEELELDDSLPDHDGSYTELVPPPLPPRTPNPSSTSADTMSPMSLAITTPRNRGGLMLCSKTQLDRWKMLLDSQQSPCQPHQYNEDEPEELGPERERQRSRSGAYRNRSLSSEFKDFLASHGMEAAGEEGEVSDESLLETSGSYSEEVRRLLGKDALLSTSLQTALDGGDPTSTNKGVLAEIAAPGVNTVRGTEEAASVDVKENSENISPQLRRGVKRRSITEAGPQTVTNVVSTVQNSNSIIFETDL